MEKIAKKLTLPPRLMTEPDLITLMDKHGIGTDATIHEHIRTIQERNYAVMTRSRHLKPTVVGLSLVEAYEQVGIKLHLPALRG